MPETDTVLTTGEVQRLLDERGVALRALPGVPLDRLSDAAPDDSGRIYGYPGSAGAPASPPHAAASGLLACVERTVDYGARARPVYRCMRVRKAHAGWALASLPEEDKLAAQGI